MSTVTDEVVDAAAETLYGFEDGVFNYEKNRFSEYSELTESDKRFYRDQARAVLETSAAARPVVTATMVAAAKKAYEQADPHENLPAVVEEMLAAALAVAPVVTENMVEAAMRAYTDAGTMTVVLKVARAMVAAASTADDYVTENHRLASEKVHELNSAALVMQAEIDFLRNALRVGSELDNHHNAGWCPYCSKRPSPEQFKSLVDDCLGIQFGKHDNEPVEVGMAAVVIHVSDTVRKGFR
jgi:hypothetical protein